MTNDRIKKLQEAIKEIREKYHQWVADAIMTQPQKSYRQIGAELGVSEATVYAIARINGLSRTDDATPRSHPANTESQESTDGGDHGN